MAKRHSRERVMEALHYLKQGTPLQNVAKTMGIARSTLRHWWTRAKLCPVKKKATHLKLIRIHLVTTLKPHHSIGALVRAIKSRDIHPSSVVNDLRYELGICPKSNKIHGSNHERKCQLDYYLNRQSAHLSF